VTPVEFLLSTWVLMLERYLACYSQGVPLSAVRYEDLDFMQQQTATAIFERCGLSTLNMDAAARAFEQDSQKGTRLARTDPDRGSVLKLTDEQRLEVQRMLEAHSLIQRADYRLPETLAL
jgi:hypothetical protein